MAGKAVVVLGGGIGGLVVANLLRDKLRDQAEITLIERKKVFEFPPSYPWVMLGERRPEQVRHPLSSLRRKGIHVVSGEISKIGLQDREVEVSGTKFSYDYLIIALGAEYAPTGIPGLADFSHHIYDLESAVKLQKALHAFEGGVVAVGVSRLPFKCPAAPYETALLIDHQLRARGLGSKFRIRFFTPEGMPLPSAGPDIGNRALEFLTTHGIEPTFKAKLTEVRPGQAIFEDGSVIQFDLLVAVPPHTCPAVVREAGLADETGWVPVEPTTMRTMHSNVYAIGDVASVPTPSGFVPYLPKAGVFAHGQAEVVANNISVEIKGRGKAKAWDGSGSCFLMTGGPQAAFVKGTWFATPRPEVTFSPPSRTSYMQRVLFEKYWMRHWF
jgi:sulfide:quinone oxidoreductase